MARRKILLLNLPGTKRYNRDEYCSGTTKGNYSWPPTDFLCLSGILSQKHSVQVLDALVERMSAEECLKKVLEMDIDTVFFITGVASWEEDSTFIKKLKEVRKDLIIVGIGGIFLFLGAKLMRENPYIDVIILDFTSDDILKYLAGKKGKIDNIIYRKNGKIINGGIVPPQNHKFSYPVPRHELFPLTKYELPVIRRYPFTNILFSIGCVRRCKFCMYGSGLPPYISRDVENTIEEMKYVKSLGIKELRFMDYSISLNKPNLKRLCERMIEEKFKFRWYALSRVDEVDEETLTLMHKAGCRTLFFGVESGDEKILKRYAKGITKEKVREIFKICKKVGVETFGSFIIGLPGEDEETINKTINFSLELDCDYAEFNVAAPYVGTEMRKEAIAKGWIDKKFKKDIFSDVAQAPIMETPWLSKERVWELRNKAIRKFHFRPSYITKRLLKVGSLRDFIVLVKVALSFISNTRK